MSSTPLIAVGIWGHSGSGKTRLVEQLLPKVAAHGLRVGSIKHASHQPTLDRPGKDSFRHTQAGSVQVLLVGPGSGTLFVPVGDEPELPFWLQLFEGRVDMVLVEGYKRTPLPHVEIQITDSPGFRLVDADSDGHPRWELHREPHEGELHYPGDVVEALAARIAGLAGAR